jgi:group I intron endonuclease
MDIESTILDTNEQVTGHIYKITNKLCSKIYIGQAVSHRKNHNKYRPFGYTGRFRDHISEALCNTKKKQCTYLNNAIRCHGKENFEVELLQRCPRNELDTMEQYFIEKFNSLYPNGYNLTSGGKTFYTNVVKNNSITEKKEQYLHTAETKRKIGVGISNFYKSSDAYGKERSMKTKNQHLAVKLDRFKDCIIDIDNFDQYIRPVISKTTKQPCRYKVVIGDISTKFEGKHDPAVLYDEAKNFVLELYHRGNNSMGLGNPQPST